MQTQDADGAESCAMLGHLETYIAIVFLPVLKFTQ